MLVSIICAFLTLNPIQFTLKSNILDKKFIRQTREMNHHYDREQREDCAMEMDGLFLYKFFLKKQWWKYTKTNLANKTNTNRGRMNEMWSQVGTNGWARTCFRLRACIFKKNYETHISLLYFLSFKLLLQKKSDNKCISLYYYIYIYSIKKIILFLVTKKLLVCLIKIII